MGVEINHAYQVEIEHSEMKKQRILSIFDKRAKELLAAATDQSGKTMYFRGDMEELSPKNISALQETRKRIANGDLAAEKSFLLEQKNRLEKDIEEQKDTSPIHGMERSIKIAQETEKLEEQLAEVNSLLESIS